MTDAPGISSSLVVRFVVPGDIVGWQRARVVNRGGFVSHFTDKRTRSYQESIRAYARQQLGATKASAWPFELEVHATLPIPASWPKWKRGKALTAMIVPTGKPDVDNIVKTVLDALNGVVWIDDAQVTRITASKRYVLEGRTSDDELEIITKLGLFVLVRRQPHQHPSNAKTSG